MSFAKSLRLNKTALLWISAFILVVATLGQALVANDIAHADQITDRSVTMASSEADLEDVTYTVSFDTAAAGDPSTEALVIQYCSDSPIVGDTCATANNFSWFSSGGADDYTEIALDNQAGITDWQVDDNTTATTLVLDRTGGAAAVTTGTTISFDIGSSGGNDGVENIDVANTSFYLRILSYATQAGAEAYVAGTPGTHIDDGGVALSTAEQITINARVQERLTFCVGTADPTSNCGGVSGSTIDLGVLDDVSINEASDAATGPGSENAYLQITTNASSGAIISFFGDNLKVSGAGCGTVNDDAGGASSVDQCINYDDDPDGGTRTGDLVAGTEMWGLGVSAITDDAGGATSNLVAETEYDLDGTPNNEYAFNDNTTTQLANTSSTVAASEQLTLDFGATAQITTPTGLYSTTLTFIATSTF